MTGLPAIGRWAVELDLYDGPSHVCVVDRELPAGKVRTGQDDARLVHRAHPAHDRSATSPIHRHQPAPRPAPMAGLGQGPVNPGSGDLEYESSGDHIPIGVQRSADGVAHLGHRVKIKATVTVDDDSNDAATARAADGDLFQVDPGGSSDPSQQLDESLFRGSLGLGHLGLLHHRRPHIQPSPPHLRPPAAYDGRCARLTIVAPEVDRRTAVFGIAAISASGLVALAGCSNSGSSRKAAPAATPGPPDSSPSVDPAAALAAELRQRAEADERRLLAACAAPAGVEPFATLRSVHQAHLHTLTGTVPGSPAPAAAPPAPAQLAALEQAAATNRRADCLRASPNQAPLLASLAASGNVAVALLVS
jgi:hypothetical protein